MSAINSKLIKTLTKKPVISSRFDNIVLLFYNFDLYLYVFLNEILFQ